MNFLKFIFGLFSPYVLSYERKVDKFFKKIKSSSNSYDIKKKLLELMQKDLVVLDLWLERKFKGYKYLKKSVRRKIYHNRDQFLKNFKIFINNFEIGGKKITDEHLSNLIKEELTEKKLDFPNAKIKEIIFLRKIMFYLQPGALYHYQEGANFGKLLLDPQKMIGDCNQIVTFYIFLFSLKFPIEQLKIKLLPDHVCLHFFGVDIEATNGTFKKYKNYEEILPVTEIISTNLLDILDIQEEVQEISPQTILKSSQLAYAISSLKPLVSKNLETAYRNLGIHALNSKDFKTAIFYFQKVTDQDLLKSTYHNAAVFYYKNKNYKKSKFYAQKKGDPELIKKIEKTLKIKEYQQLSEKIKKVKNINDARNYKSTYRKMLQLAKSFEDQALVEKIEETLKKL